MEKRKFKIGDLVRDAFYGQTVFKIVGSKEQPYKHDFGVVQHEIFPNPGTDYVIIENTIARDEFKSFKHASEKELRPVN